MNRRERRAAGSKSKAASREVSAISLTALHEDAVRHMRAGRHRDAQLCCRRILQIDAGHVDTLHLMGLLSLHAKQYDTAIEWIGRANRQDPKSDYLLSLGTALEQQGLHREALKALENALKHKPDDAELWTRLAEILVLLRQLDRAISSLEHALGLSPRYWLAANNCALLLLKLERFEEALVKLNLCDELQPHHAPTLQARVWALLSLNRFEEVLSEGERALALDPTSADVHNNVGVAMQKLARHEDALEHFDSALDLRPNFLTALDNKAFTLSEIQRFGEAILLYRHIKEIDPDNAQADWNASLIQLRWGDFKDGWQRREARWKMPALSGTANYPKFPKPMWQGERGIAGKTILVCADEGLGDTIQFVRYVPMLAALGARVILLPQESLYSLLSGLPGVSQCLPNLRGGLPAFDLHCPVMSLPLAFGTTLDSIPTSASYLPRPAEARVQAFEDRLGPRDQLRIGLVWSGNSQHWNDHNRSIPLGTLSRIIVADATFLSLQKDPRPEDKAALRERADIIDLTEHLTDFNETAALIGCLDLVVTVDTSVAHLAGALGCPTWILLPSVPDWRWLLNRDDSPWYPTARLFRQTTARDYESVVDRVRTELLALIRADFSSRKEVRPPASDC
jgi:tetratricopeptide (TPR) repeat protein